MRSDLVAVAILAAPFVAVFAYWWVILRRDGLQDRVGEFVAIQLENTVLRGVLTGVHRDVLVLRDAAELTTEADVDLGESAVLVPRSRITYVQVGPEVTRDALAA